MVAQQNNQSPDLSVMPQVHEGTIGVGQLDSFGEFLLELKEDREFRQWFLKEFGEQKEWEKKELMA